MTLQARPPQRVGHTVVVLAWLNIGLHLIGLALAAAFIRPGSPLTPISERINYLVSSPAGWRFAWAVWVACSVAMVSYTLCIAAVIRSRPARWAAGLALAAAAVDLTCDDLFIFLFPNLAARAELNAEEFLHVERLTGLVSLTVANGLYSVSTLLMTLALCGRPYVVPVGVAVFVSGMLLAAAGITGVPQHAFWATPATIGLYCVWVYLVARTLTRDEGGP
jgi:hypothetical protein